MPQNPEGFACAIHELRLNIEAALTDNPYYLASHKLRELREIAGPAAGTLTEIPAAVESKPALAEIEPLIAAPFPAPEPEAPPPGFGDALAALRASVKMEVWDDRYYEAVRLINGISDAASAAGVRAPQARLPHPRYTVADSFRRVRRAVAAELHGNAYYSVARGLQTLAELLPQEPVAAPQPAPAPVKAAAPQPQASGPAKPRSFDDLAAASARRVARLAHPASMMGLGNGEFLERRSSEPCAMGERLR